MVKKSNIGHRGSWGCLKASINSRVFLVESVEGMVNSISFELVCAKENKMIEEMVSNENTTRSQ